MQKHVLAAVPRLAMGLALGLTYLAGVPVARAQAPAPMPPGEDLGLFEPEPPVGERSWQRTLGSVSAGVLFLGASLGAIAIPLSIAMDDDDPIDCNPGCVDTGRLMDQRNATRQLANASIAMMGAGLVGTLVFFLWPEAEPDGHQVSLGLAPGQGQLSVGGSF